MNDNIYMIIDHISINDYPLVFRHGEGYGFPADLGMSAGCGGNLQVEVVPLCELLSEEWLLKPLKRRFLLRARTRRTIHIYIYMGFYGI